jgi:hypothetical protein
MFPDPIISTMDPPAWEGCCTGAPQTRIREGDLQERDPYVRGGKKSAACMLQVREANTSARWPKGKLCLPLSGRCAGKHRMNIGVGTDVVSFKGSALSTQHSALSMDVM